MQLHYWREHPNFGDALNAWLWPQLLDGILDDNDDTMFVGIGTLLRSDMPRRRRTVVFGTGAGYGERPRIDDRWTIYCVRGPLTAEALGLPPQAAITDGAALIRLLDLPTMEKRYPVAFMPHWESIRYWDWAAVCAAAGVKYIDPLGATEVVLRSIGSSELVVAEAMHGAIVADALRVPWIAVRSSGQILNFKWEDWCSSLGLSYDPVVLPALYDEQTFRTVLPKRLRSRLLPRYNGDINSVNRVFDAIGAGVGHMSRSVYQRKAARIATLLGRIASQRAPALSSDNAIKTATARLEAQLERFRADAHAGRFAPCEAHTMLGGERVAKLQLEGSP